MINAMSNRKKIPPIVCLKYKKGDLVIKEGDYGISIYKIIKGKVQVFKEIEEGEVVLSVLGVGDIVGEMTFLKGPSEPRRASVRALEDLELEAWHFSRLRKEYNQMPAILKYIATQSLKRLTKTNKMRVKLDSKRKEAERLKKRDPWASQRRYYRKEVDLDCVYRPENSSSKTRLKGHITDISFIGIKLEVSNINARNHSHECDDVFAITTVLPNGKEINVVAKVRSVNKDSSPGKNLMGMFFTRISDEVRKNLGFFLQP
jgi:CRP-like cAMP-binding protein